MDSMLESQVVPKDIRPGRDSLKEEVLAGLLKEPKELPCKYLYDERGALLFEDICTLDEYYVPCVESEIMEANIQDIADHLGRNILLLEYGCGDCVKTRLLLDNLEEPAAFVPIDISWEQLQRVSMELDSEYPALELLPVCADYTDELELPTAARPVDRRVAYFPGSTIGNFEPDEARGFLEGIAEICGRGGAMLIGVDLKKDPRLLHAAYNDSRGVTAAFNMNLLERINRELGCDFQMDRFEHYAFYNPRNGRVEMHLVSLQEQVVHLDGRAIAFSRGESIWTENSYKYSMDDFELLAADAGFTVEKAWTDKRHWFSVQYLVNADGL